MTLQWLFALLIVGSANDDLQKDVEDQMGQCINILSYTQSFYEGLPDFGDNRRRLATSGGNKLEDDVEKSLETCMTVVQATNSFYEALEERYEIDAGDPWEDPIVLNVGGTLFSTTLATLLSKNGTYFEQMFRSRSIMYSPDGTFFIDRNPMTFKFILDFLRTGDLLVESKDNDLRWYLLEDAEFFELPERVIEYIQYSAFLGIDITMSEFEWLNMKLPGNYTLGGLLYDTSIDGDRVSTFHAACDSEGPTVTLIETSNGNVFGGFTTQSFNSNNRWVTDIDAFVFILRPTPMKKFSVSSSTTAVYTHRSYGPYFGNTAFRISDNCQDSVDSYVSDNSYHDIDDDILNDGAKFFRVYNYAVVQAVL